MGQVDDDACQMIFITYTIAGGFIVFSQVAKVACRILQI